MRSQNSDSVDRGNQIDAAVLLGEWELASRGLEGLVKDMKDRAEAGFAVGEISLAMKVLRAAISKALNGAIEAEGCEADDKIELKNLHAEVLRMRQEEPRQLQSQKEKYDKLLIQAKQEGRTEKELEPFYEVGSNSSHRPHPLYYD